MRKVTINGVVYDLMFTKKVGDDYFYTVGEKSKHVVPADEMLEDVLSEISATGAGVSVCYETITDSYRKKGWDWQKLEAEHLKKLLAYMNEIREDDVADNEEDSDYYQLEPFTLEDLPFRQ
jgi:hypothetical protein